MTSETQDPFDPIIRLRDGGEGGAPESAEPPTGNAIDRIMARPARRARVHFLRDHLAIIGFRWELQDGLVRADTVRQVLGSVRLAIEAKRS